MLDVGELALDFGEPEGQLRCRDDDRRFAERGLMAKELASDTEDDALLAPGEVAAIHCVKSSAIGGSEAAG